MSIFKICACGVIFAIIVILLKKERADFAALTEIAGVGVILLMIITYIPKLVGAAMTAFAFADANTDYLSLLLKVMCIAAVGETAASVCRDSGSSAIAAVVETAAKIIITAMCLPLIETVVKFACGLIN